MARSLISRAVTSGEEKKKEDEKRQTQAEFNFFARSLHKYGQESGTGHKRVVIPKSVLTKDELEKTLGFLPVNIAIPESGQDKFTSYRHPSNLFHIHSHDKMWTMHEDRYAASTMMIEKWKQEQAAGNKSSVFNPIGSFFKGMPHVATEGAPGLFYYLEGQLSGGEDMAERLKSELPPGYMKFIGELDKRAGGDTRRYLGRADKYIEKGGAIPEENAAYNPIQGLPDWGMGPHSRLGTLAFVGAVGGTAAYSLTYPLIKQDISKYPRLAALRAVGEKHGFKMLDPYMRKRDFKNPFIRLSAGGIEFIDQGNIGKLSGFKGVLSLGRSDRDFIAAEHGFTGLEIDRITPMTRGPSGKYRYGKLADIQYLEARGLSSSIPRTIGVDEMFKGGRITPAGHAFVKAVGGTPKNMVLKGIHGAESQAVWMNPNLDVLLEGKDFSKYLLQERLDLAEEFRAVTVGGKSIYTAHRFGPSKLTSAIQKVGKRFPGVADWITKSHIFQNTIPVVNPKMKQGLEAFAEKIAKELPYDIGALDIGLTKGGEFKLIETQKVFGTIRNPVVNRRIRHAITGETGKFRLAATAVGAGLAMMAAFGIISGSNDAHNTEEGLSHGGLQGSARPKRTDFGSGYRTGEELPSSYISRMKLVSEEGNWYFPEQYKVGVVESARGQIGKLRGDMAWENWLTAHYDPLEKKMMEKPIASVKQLSKSPITRKHLKWLAAIGGALYLTHKIFGKDDKHNTIEGFQELGLASKMRKRDTAFGSGWDAIRGMAKTAGISFEKFIAKKSFQEALSSAVVKETFRPGSFGSAHLMKTEFRGQKFEFVKKVLHSEEEMVAKQVGLGVKKETIVGEIASRGGRENMAKAEAEVTRMFGEKFAPSIYRQEGGEIFMEHMPGESISAAIKAGKVSKQQLTTEMTSHIKDLSEKGVYNADIHAGNIRHFVDPTKGTSHVVWIDYGEAQRMGAGSIADAGFLSQLMHKEMKGKLMAKLAKDYPAQMASKQMSPLRLAPEAEDLIEQSGSSIKSKIIRKKPVVPMKRLPPGPKQVPRPRPSPPPAEGYEKFRSIIASRFEENQAIAYGKTRIADTVLASQDLQRAQEQIWINIGGSRNHVKRRSSRSVVSLSRFDKSVK